MTVLLGWVAVVASVVVAVPGSRWLEAQMRERESGWQGRMAALGRCVDRVNEGET